MTVLVIGGSVLFDNNREIQSDLLYKYVREIDRHKNKIDVVVTGGGSIAREYIRVGRDFGLCDDELDRIGINVTRANARLISELLPDAHLIYNLGEIESSSKISVIGGTKPSQTTDTVGAKACNIVDSDELLFCSDIPGIYNDIESKDEVFAQIEASHLLENMFDSPATPGRNIPIDRSALQKISSSAINAIVFNGMDIENLIDVLNGTHVGTRVH
jgi:uridylate kinase